MKAIAIISHKGGAGKTTVAVNLALAIKATGACVLLADADPVRSASECLRQRADCSDILVETSAAKLAALSFVSATRGCDVLVIDTAGGPENGMIEALKMAHLSIVISRPTYLDVAAAIQTVNTVRQLGRKGMVLFNQCPPQRMGVTSATVSAIMESLRAGRMDVCPTVLQARAVYQHAIARGKSVMEYEPGGRAQAEIKDLLNDVETRIMGPRHSESAVTRWT